MKLWITMLLPDYEDKIISILVKDGFVVGALGESGKPTSHTDATIGAILALRVDKSNSKLTKKEFIEKLRDKLTASGIQFFSIVVETDAGGPIWLGSNVKYDKSKATDLGSPYRNNLN